MFAIMPPEDLTAQIHEKRVDFFKRYGYDKALKPPVHITLYEPFHIANGDVPHFELHMEQLHAWASRQTPFQVKLLNYNFFNNKNSRVVYIDVVRNEQLRSLHATFHAELKNYIPIHEIHGPYRPHFTIGYRDIPADAFPAIRNYYSRQQFSGSFQCDAIHLWKHDGVQWQVEDTYKFTGKYNQSSLF